jgi:hypothetical protein
MRNNVPKILLKRHLEDLLEKMYGCKSDDNQV